MRIDRSDNKMVANDSDQKYGNMPENLISKNIETISWGCLAVTLLLVILALVDVHSNNIENIIVQNRSYLAKYRQCRNQMSVYPVSANTVMSTNVFVGLNCAN